MLLARSNRDRLPWVALTLFCRAISWFIQNRNVGSIWTCSLFHDHKRAHEQRPRLLQPQRWWLLSSLRLWWTCYRKLRVKRGDNCSCVYMELRASRETLQGGNENESIVLRHSSFFLNGWLPDGPNHNVIWVWQEGPLLSNNRWQCRRGAANGLFDSFSLQSTGNWKFSKPWHREVYRTAGKSLQSLFRSFGPSSISLWNLGTSDCWRWNYTSISQNHTSKAGERASKWTQATKKGWPYIVARTLAWLLERRAMKWMHTAKWWYYSTGR